MDIDKKTIFAFLLIILVLIFTQTDFYKRMVLPPEKITPSEEKESETFPSGKEPVQPEKTEKTEVTEQPRIEVLSKEGQEVENVTANKYSHLIEPGENVTIDTDLYSAIFSTQGATIRSWTLKNYLAADSSLVQLVGEDGFGNLAILLPSFEDTIDTSPYVFTVNKNKIVLNNDHPTDQLEFTLDLGNYRKIKKIFTFYQNKHSIDLSVEFRNINDLVEGFSYYMIWRTGLNTTEPNFKDDMRNAHAYALQGDIIKFDAKNEFKIEDDPTDWVAIRTKYFLVAAIPTNVKGQAVRILGEQVPVEQKGEWKKYRFDLQMPFYDRATIKDSYVIYLGPLDYDSVKSYGVGLEKLMDFGWAPIRPFSKLVLWSFKGLHKVIPNYGLVIIIFSILIKLILYPLTRKSYKSMKEMQALQPLMQELNEKHKNDPQKKQQELMKLYKEHGVNPLGGCIPMVLQMPLLFALFTVFRSTIQLRGASFVWWIKDLSQPDTVATLPFTLPLYGNLVNILPLFMGATMFVQQKISMKDPKQKAMVYFMPIFFTLLFNSFPSGLNLYYALFNLFSIIQEKLIPYHPESSGAPKDKKKSTTKKKKYLYHSIWTKYRRV